MAPGVGTDEVRFDLAWRGFRRDQVIEFVEWAEAEFRRLTEEREAAARRAEALAEENRELRAKVDRISRTPIEPDALQERSRRMVELTREEAAEILAHARESAERTRRAAEQEAVRLTAEERRLVAEAEAAAERQRRELEEAERTAEARRRELDEAAAHRRARLEEDHTRAMNIRRAESMRELAEQEAAARAKADQLVAEATQRSEAMVAAAEREVAALARVRDQLKATMSGCRELLAEAAVALDGKPGGFDPEATLPMAKRVPKQRIAPADLPG